MKEKVKLISIIILCYFVACRQTPSIPEVLRLPSQLYFYPNAKKFLIEFNQEGIEGKLKGPVRFEVMGDTLVWLDLKTDSFLNITYILPINYRISQEIPNESLTFKRDDNQSNLFLLIEQDSSNSHNSKERILQAISELTDIYTDSTYADVKFEGNLVKHAEGQYIGVFHSTSTKNEKYKDNLYAVTYIENNLILCILKIPKKELKQRVLYQVIFSFIFNNLKYKNKFIFPKETAETKIEQVDFLTH